MVVLLLIIPPVCSAVSSDTAQFVCWFIISSGSQLRKSIKISEQNTPTLTLLNKINNGREKNLPPAQTLELKGT